jgi:hypothetical protein
VTAKADVPDFARLQGLLRRLHSTTRAEQLPVCLDRVDAVKLPQVDLDASQYYLYRSNFIGFMS